MTSPAVRTGAHGTCARVSAAITSFLLRCRVHAATMASILPERGIRGQIGTLNHRVGALSEQRCRYLLRPPVAQDRVRLRADGRVLVELKTVWRDGPSHLLFEPIECMEKLAAIIPRPAINLVVYHGARPDGA